MYTRVMTDPPARIVHNGRIHFGSFKGFPTKLDIRGVRGPFVGVPLPKFITNFRIHSSLMFMLNIGPYVGSVDFYDHKIFGFADVILWNKENGRKIAYRSFMGPRRRFIPHNMNLGFCASFNKHRYIRISWDHLRDRISLIFNLKGDSSRPFVQAAFIAHFSDDEMCEVSSVVPAPSKRRCSATCLSNPQIHGSISFDKTKLSGAVTNEDLNGQALVSINRTYYNFHAFTEFVAATGVYNDKKFAFQIFTTQENAVDAENINGNYLIVNGECTPLPPVRITHPFGVSRKWIIQDFDNMVDLTFTPSSNVQRNISFLVMRSKLRTIYGTFEGTVKTKDGESIVLHSFAGLAKNQLLRL